MASGLYAKGREGFLDGTIDWDTDDIRIILIDTASYTVNLATHDNLDDVAAGARAATSDALATKTVAGGVAGAANKVLSAVTAGDPCEALIIYQHTGTESTSRLIAYIDGFTVTPNGGDITIQWDAGANLIFKL